MKIAAASIACALFLYSTSALAQVPHVLGVWEFDPQASELPTGFLLASETRSYDLRDDGYLVNVVIRKAPNGHPDFIQVVSKSDGKDYPQYQSFPLAEFQITGRGIRTTIPFHQRVQPGGEEARHRLVHGVHDGLRVVVEGGVEDDGDAGELLERPQERPVAGVGVRRHGLHPRGAVHVRHRAQDRAGLRAHAQGEGHEGELGDRRRQLEPVAGALQPGGGRKGAVPLALLDHGVDAVLVLRRARVRQDAAVAQRARPLRRMALRPCRRLAERERSPGFGGWGAILLP